MYLQWDINILKFISMFIILKKPFFFLPRGIFKLTAVHNARSLARQADVIAAITLEVLKGTTRAFDKGKCHML